MSSGITKNVPARVPVTLTRLLRNRKVWAISGLAIVAVGFALKWDWLTAVGAVPVLLNLLPCVAMCALGLCMRGGSGKSCHGEGAGTQSKPSPVSNNVGK
jgi:hypothetical protein